MRYQLVLQFRGDSLADYDQMIALEERLIDELGQSANVDVHDCGSGETNIFIHTNDPAETFRIVSQLLKQEGTLGSVTAAYREVRGKQYIVLWPEGSTEQFKIA